jgi:hypothetical protein
MAATWTVIGILAAFSASALGVIFAELRGTRAEVAALHGEFRVVERDVGARIDKVRTELAERIEAGDAGLAQRIDEVRTELAERIEAGDAGLAQRIDELEASLSSRILELTGAVHHVRGQVDVLVALHSPQRPHTA